MTNCHVKQRFKTGDIKYLGEFCSAEEIKVHSLKKVNVKKLDKLVDSFLLPSSSLETVLT